MKVAIIGTGYVGLVTGTCLADSGHDVACIDIDAGIIDQLNDSKIPIFEPGLEDLVRRSVEEGRLTFSTNLAEEIARAQIAFIAVGTPEDDDGSADVSAVKEVARDIGRAMQGKLIVVLKSTVPPGTNAVVRDILGEETSHPYHVVSNPEFLKEGNAISDFLTPDRVVIGTESEEALAAMSDLYEPFVSTQRPLLVMDPASAELTKYASNAFLATKITFMNEIARLCEQIGADVTKVRPGVGSDSRIGQSFLYAGVGYGGSCFPKDIRALKAVSKERRAPLRILEAVDSVNEDQKLILVRKIRVRYGDDLSGHTFAMWGLAFKPGTDDVRHAPSLTIIQALAKQGARVRAHDPEARDKAENELERMGLMKHATPGLVEIVDRPYDALPGASALICVTEWNEFRNPDFKRIRSLLEEPVIFDGRNMYAEKGLIEQGFEYHGIGIRDSINR